MLPLQIVDVAESTRPNVRKQSSDFSPPRFAARSSTTPTERSVCILSETPRALFLPDLCLWFGKADNVTVYSHFLHMHENGRRLQTRQYRNDSSGNEEMVHSAEVEFYSFEQAGGHPVYTDGTITIQVGERGDELCMYVHTSKYINTLDMGGCCSEASVQVTYARTFVRYSLTRSLTWSRGHSLALTEHACFMVKFRLRLTEQLPPLRVFLWYA